MTPKNPDLGLYVHIPFCHARCGYCDFVTFTGQEQRLDAYVEDLCREFGMAAELEAVDNRAIQTVFFGGGTPSLLKPQHVERIIHAAYGHFAMNMQAEITMEANPESITAESAKGWRRAGVNRLSIGLQAYDDHLLKAMDRLHTVAEFEAAYRAARAARFENINIDLIYGFSGQTPSDWQDTLRQTAALEPEHLSLYALKIEEHTPFKARGVSVDEDLQADMYEWARAFLAGKGYRQYEISNFARADRACRHNLLYWRQQDYIGAGVGAVGSVGNMRWENHKNLDAYGRDIAAGKLPRASAEALSAETRRLENLMLGLRLREGMLWPDTDPAWLAERAKLEARGLLEKLAGDLWRIPDSAVALTNQVLLPFV